MADIPHIVDTDAQMKLAITAQSAPVIVANLKKKSTAFNNVTTYKK
jgi:hypothetical protein